MKPRNELGGAANGWWPAEGLGEGELRKVVTSEGLGIGERCHLRLLPAPTTISLASFAVAVRPRLQRSILLQPLISLPDDSLQNGAASPLY